MPSLKLTAHEALLFLHNYSFEDAEALGVDCCRLDKNTDGGKSEVERVNDVIGYISIDADKQQVTLEVEVPGGTKTFTSVAPYTWTGRGSTPATLPKTVSRRKGRFFTRNQDPSAWATSNIIVQEFPPYSSAQPSGRLLMDCWTSDGVIGVFKTDEENYVGGARGVWA